MNTLAEPSVIEAATLLGTHLTVVKKYLGTRSASAKRIAKVCAVLSRDCRFASLDESLVAQAWAIAQRKRPPQAFEAPAAKRAEPAPPVKLGFPTFRMDKGSPSRSPHPEDWTCRACLDASQEGWCPGCPFLGGVEP
jgi:hypothetical protein